MHRSGIRGIEAVCFVHASRLSAFGSGTSTGATFWGRHEVSSVDRNGFLPTLVIGQAWGMVRILVIDNYDSFVYNLVQYLGEFGADPIVIRNDALSVVDLVALKPDAVLLSPGPGRPETAGILCEAVTAFAGRVPVLGVCLGHQAIGHVYGARVVRAPELVHGKSSEVFHNNEGVFIGIDSPLTATRYHSLVLEPNSLPAELIITAHTQDGMIMGVRHRTLDVEGVQFHPESILTTAGHHLMGTFVARAMKQSMLS